VAEAGIFYAALPQAFMNACSTPPRDTATLEPL